MVGSCLRGACNRSCDGSRTALTQRPDSVRVSRPDRSRAPPRRNASRTARARLEDASSAASRTARARLEDASSTASRAARVAENKETCRVVSPLRARLHVAQPRPAAADPRARVGPGARSVLPGYPVPRRALALHHGFSSSSLARLVRERRESGAGTDPCPALREADRLQPMLAIRGGLETFNYHPAGRHVLLRVAVCQLSSRHDCIPGPSLCHVSTHSPVLGVRCPCSPNGPLQVHRLVYTPVIATTTWSPVKRVAAR